MLLYVKLARFVRAAAYYKKTAAPHRKPGSVIDSMRGQGGVGRNMVVS